MMRVLVCGSRDWANEDVIRMRLRMLPRETIIMHGGCRGADTIASAHALSLGMIVDEYPANWRERGKQAGVLRNLLMLDQKPDRVLAFQRNGSTGTQHVIDETRKRGIPLEVFSA
jgi:hypothetical protein